MRLTSIFFQTFKNVITKIIIHNIFMYTNYILAIKVFNLEYYFGQIRNNYISKTLNKQYIIYRTCIPIYYIYLITIPICLYNILKYLICYTIIILFFSTFTRITSAVFLKMQSALPILFWKSAPSRYYNRLGRLGRLGKVRYITAIII